MCQNPYFCPKIQVDENAHQKVNVENSAKSDYFCREKSQLFEFSWQKLVKMTIYQFLDVILF